MSIAESPGARQRGFRHLTRPSLHAPALIEPRDVLHPTAELWRLRRHLRQKSARLLAFGHRFVEAGFGAGLPVGLDGHVERILLGRLCQGAQRPEETEEPAMHVPVDSTGNPRVPAKPPTSMPQIG